MGRYVLDLRDIDRSHVASAGGKGANLGELARIEGVVVPPGFCVTTDAYQRVLAQAPSIPADLERLSRLRPDARDEVAPLSAKIRDTIEAAAMPRELVAAITDAIARFGTGTAWAVRSSATAEDSPTVSFAGQQDSFLNVVGPDAVLVCVRRCWASLFTERAVTYRLRNGLDQSKAQMAVVVQRMVVPRAAGVLFTADPMTGNRKVASVEATRGTGEALASGRVNADVYTVRNGQVAAERIAGAQPALREAEVVRLERLGRRIEAHFGSPQDIEWCLADDAGFQFVQSRPITTLFPIPKASDGENHVYLSVGHQQMMTDAIRPLGISVRELTAAAPFHEAGGRQFVDVTRMLASPSSRAALLALSGKSDPLTRDALQTLLDRGDFIPPAPDGAPAPPVVGSVPATIETDPAIVAGLIARSEASVAALKRDIRALSGAALLGFIRADFQELKRILFDPVSHQAIMAGMEAAWWLNDHLAEWLGETNAADTLTQSVPDNVTAEMGLALLDVADVIRPHAAVVEFLGRADLDDGFLDALPGIPGGRAARDAIVEFLDRYGMRCPGEIDITRPRWREHPAMLVPVILGNVRHFEPGAAARRFESGRRAAAAKEKEVLARLRALPDGAAKAAETKRMIDRVRTFAGYREYPKYGMISRYFVYRQSLLAEAARLARAGVIRDAEDIFYLTFDELHDVARTNEVNEALIRERREAYARYRALEPPRVLTSDGEMLWGAYHREDAPAGALVGLPVSAGTVEGRARVILTMEEAHLEPGDILVTAYTDPSWTPVFVGIDGLVTEIGGPMTHGAVIAREYGLPAVVGVDRATRLIRDGQRIRVHGSAGYVELLDEPR